MSRHLCLDIYDPITIATLDFWLFFESDWTLKSNYQSDILGLLL